MPFADVLIYRRHPIFSGGSFAHDYLLDEVEAAGAMPLDTYWQQSREDRIMRVAAHVLRKMMDAIGEYDAIERTKKKHGR